MAKAAAAGQASTETGKTTDDAAAAAKAAADAAAAAGTQTDAEKAAADAKAKADADAAAGKGAGDQAGAGEAAGKGEAGKAGDPPPAELKLTVPEGAEDLVSADQLAYFAEVAKASNWSNDDANAELAAHVEREKARIAAQSTKWADETKADTEVGGDNLAATQRHITAVLDRFLPATEPDGKALRTALNAGGYGNYRPLVKFLARIGKAMGEDSPLQGAPPSGQKSTEDTLYDHPSSKAST